MKHLLKFDEAAYNVKVKSIGRTAELLREASKQLEELGMGRIPPKKLSDGKIYERAEAFLSEKWKASPLKELSFAKWKELIETDIEHLKTIEQSYKDYSAISFKFYKSNNLFYSHFEHRPEKEIHERAGKKIEIQVTDLFKWKNDKEIEVTLNPEYFKLYATESQMRKIKDVEELVLACKKMGVSYKLVREAVGPWVRDLSYDLEHVEVDPFYLLKNLQ